MMLCLALCCCVVVWCRSVFFCDVRCFSLLFGRSLVCCLVNVLCCVVPCAFVGCVLLCVIVWCCVLFGVVRWWCVLLCHVVRC